MKKIVLLGLIACALPAPASFAQRGVAALLQRGAGAEAHQREGARLALEGRLEEAAKAFEQAAALDPTNGGAFYGLGNVYAELGRWEDASHAYYKAIDLNKEDVEAHNNLGVALAMRGLHRQAAAAFERAIKIYPKWAEPFYHLGEARRALGQEAEARAAFDKALRLRPDYATRPPRPFAAARTQTAAAPQRSRVLEAMNAVGVGPKAAEESAAAPTPGADSAPLRAGSPSRSVDAPAPTSSARPAPAPPAASPSNPFDLGTREARAGRHREAVAAFRQAVILDRRNAAAYSALGDSYAALGDWRNSVDAYEQAARLSPDDAETYQKLGRAYARLRETAGAAGEAEGSRAAGAGAATPAATTPPAASRTGAATTTGAARPSANDPDPTAVYRVGPGDVLDVRLLNGRERRTTAYEVTPTGLLDYPALREPLAVAGLTVEEVAARARSRATGRRRRARLREPRHHRRRHGQGGRDENPTARGRAALRHHRARAAFARRGAGGRLRARDGADEDGRSLRPCRHEDARAPRRRDYPASAPETVRLRRGRRPRARPERFPFGHDADAGRPRRGRCSGGGHDVRGRHAAGR